MHTFYLQLLTFPECQTANGVCGPRAYIAVKASSTVRCPTKKGDRDFTAISPECMSAADIRDSADTLIRELQTIRDQARRFFSTQKPHPREQTDTVNDVGNRGQPPIILLTRVGVGR
jgi:hypothetical protein